LAKAELDMREGRIMGAEFYRLKHEINEKLHLLERLARGDKLRETMYEDEVEDLDEVARRVSVPPPPQRRRRPTQLEVAHDIGRQIKIAANALLAMSEWTGESPKKMRQHLEFIALRCYLYHKAIGLERGRDLLYVDRDDPSKLHINDNIKFVSYYIKQHAAFWAIEPREIPDLPRDKPAPKHVSVANRKAERRRRQAQEKLQQEIAAAEERAEDRRSEQKTKRFEKAGIPLLPPATDEEKRAMTENSLKVLKRAMKSADVAK
jgi:hypothetical protein